VCPTVEKILTEMIDNFQDRAATPREHKLTPRALEIHKAKEGKTGKDEIELEKNIHSDFPKHPESGEGSEKRDALRWLHEIGVLDVEVWKVQHETRHLNWFSRKNITKEGNAEDSVGSSIPASVDLSDSSTSRKKKKKEKPQKQKKEKRCSSSFTNYWCVCVSWGWLRLFLILCLLQRHKREKKKKYAEIDLTIGTGGQDIIAGSKDCALLFEVVSN
jgi:hypothetical protein